MKTATEKQQLVDEWQSSGLSKSKFCHQHNIPVSTFYGYLPEKKKVKVVSSTKLPLRINFANGVNVDVERNELKLIKFLISLT